MSSAVLWQFRRSPYNEKARWALALAGRLYERRTLLPGPHVAYLLRTGQTKTPALQLDGRWILGSGTIVRALAPSLLPDEMALAHEATALEARFDNDLTPRIRRAILAALLADRDAWVETFAGDESETTQARYRSAMVVLAPVVRAANGIRGKASVEDGVRAIDEALDLLTNRLEGRSYLVGEMFSVADVTAASTLSAVFGAEHPDASYGPCGRAALASLQAAWSKHPAQRWMNELYANHRSRSS